jgi:hypothetical protein
LKKLRRRLPFCRFSIFSMKMIMINMRMKVRTTSFSLIFSLNNLWIQIVYSTANIIKRIKIMIRSTTKRSTIITKRSILSTIRMMTQRLKLKFQMLRTLCYLQTPRLSHSTIVLLLNSQQLRTIRRSKK